VRVSVVIAVTRASVVATLAGLRHQRHRDFEVVLVAGPGAPGPEPLRRAAVGPVRIVGCAERNVSRARNLGAAAALGEVIAYIDDDAVPEADWLSGLVRSFADPAVQFAGGPVLGPDGRELQYHRMRADRQGRVWRSEEPPRAAELLRGADPFAFFAGANLAVRRGALTAVAGFDERFDCGHEDVDLCLRLIDAGARPRVLDHSAVHHHHDVAASDPTRRLGSLARFAAIHAPSKSRGYLDDHLRELARDTRGAHARGELDDDDLACRLARLHAVARPPPLPPRVPWRGGGVPALDWRPFLDSSAVPLSVAILSREPLPCGEPGGVARAAESFAAALAGLGHDVHLVSPVLAGASVSWTGELWRHRVRAVDRVLGLGADEDVVVAADLHREVLTLHERLRLDVVLAPLWRTPGLVCALDPRLPTVTRLVTSAAEIAPMLRGPDVSRIATQVRLERALLTRVRVVQCASRAVLEDCRRTYGAPREGARVVDVPLAVPDRSERHRPLDPGRAGPVEVLFVGRIERRKGIDVLLAAVEQLHAGGEQPRLTIIGAAHEHGRAELELLQRACARRPAHVRYLGSLDDSALWDHFASAHVLCAPSRYESFGHVLVEGMMFGRPVIGARAGGMSEVIADGVDGLLADPGDADSLAALVGSLLHDPERRSALGQAARCTWERRFAAPVVAARAAELYRGLERPAPAGDQNALAPLLAATLRETAPGHGDPEALAAALLAERAGSLARMLAEDTLWCLRDEEFIDAAYRVVLGRAVDPSGYERWRQALSESVTRRALVAELAASGEGRLRAGGHDWVGEIEQQRVRASADWLRVRWTLASEDFVRCAYLALLWRRPDAAAQPWVAHLGAGGPARLDLLAALAQGAEDEGAALPHGLERLYALGESGTLER
jgi:hypothetical protein